ncbi:hypothetical protein PoB_004462100 [Plakobranchus ocellatus]|uniref:Uncharacterized protein n=1 Tax=Plakobranchus ocellatus TaxID=259542 RepID=A0AAV4B442_9GAST|nr:hypothetical protein PoB_004462100 [Plakobranchus ocellatus]
MRAFHVTINPNFPADSYLPRWAQRPAGFFGFVWLVLCAAWQAWQAWQANCCPLHGVPSYALLWSGPIRRSRSVASGNPGTLLASLSPFSSWISALVVIDVKHQRFNTGAQRNSELLTAPRMGFEPRTSDLIANCPTK